MKKNYFWNLVFIALVGGTSLQGGDPSKKIKWGVICALPKELGELDKEMEELKELKTIGMRAYIRGTLWGNETVLTTSRVGKVAAAITATHLIESEEVDAIIFLGIARAIDRNLRQGDIIIGEELVQYDMDSTPFIPQFMIPLIQVSFFKSDQDLTARGSEAAENFLLSKTTFNRVYRGLIGTGDRFITDAFEKEALQSALPNLLAVDMEGAAVAQVCYEHEIPFVVIRTISDGCDQDSAASCREFLKEIAPTYTREILHRFYLETPAVPQ